MGLDAFVWNKLVRYRSMSSDLTVDDVVPVVESQALDSMLKAPFPWFGGKSRVAHLVWDRFGDCDNYVEPFAGSLAVLLSRPGPPQTETVNDLDCFLANFWRALKADPEAVAHHADWPVNEADLHARHLWLVNQVEFRERMKTKPDFYDVKIAGWWVWGISQWIGSGWCAGRTYSKLPHLGDAGRGVNRQLPHLGTAGMGVNRKLPHLGDAGMGVNRKLPHLGDAGRGVEVPEKRPHLSGRGSGVGIHSDANSEALWGYFAALAARLRRVRVCCGDWARVTGPSVTIKHGVCGVFLDPPYSAEADRAPGLYSEDDLQIAHQVRNWAIENGDNGLLRIALCGYEGEHDMPDSWECVAWKTGGGFASQGSGVNENAARERIWFSPHCLRLQESLFPQGQNRPDWWMKALGFEDELREQLLYTDAKEEL